MGVPWRGGHWAAKPSAATEEYIGLLHWRLSLCLMPPQSAAAAAEMVGVRAVACAVFLLLCMAQEFQITTSCRTLYRLLHAGTIRASENACKAERCLKTLLACSVRPASVLDITFGMRVTTMQV